MAMVTVKCFGVLRVDSKIDTVDIESSNIGEVFEKINALIESDMTVSFSQALTYINGDLCTSKHEKLHDGDEVWVISAASLNVKKPEKKTP